MAKANQALVKDIRGQLQSSGMIAALRDAVPITARKYLPPERIVRIVTTAISRSPTLLECEPQTILRSVVDLVQLGLEPGGPLGHAYLVPFNNRKTGKRECQPIVGYQGYLELARRSGNIESVFAQVIYSRDKYRIVYGDDPRVEHEPALDGDRGKPVAVYCVAKFVGGGKHVEVMTLAEVEAIRARSQSGKSDFGPWRSDWEMMARKTVIRRARHYWPISVEMAQAADLDDRVDTGITIDAGELETQATEALPPAGQSNGNGGGKTRKVLDRMRGAAGAPEAHVEAPAHDPQTGEVADEPGPDEMPPWDGGVQ